MSQLVPARPLIVMPQEDIALRYKTKSIMLMMRPCVCPFDSTVCGCGGTHVQTLETVPAEGVFAALAQHLGTALVPLDVDAAHGALLDGRVGDAAGAKPADPSDGTWVRLPGGISHSYES